MKKEELEKMSEELGIEIGDPREFKISWWDRLTMRFFPKFFLKSSAKELGLDGKKIDLAYDIFEGTKIHIEPLSGSSRGFIITLDNKLSLWFLQDGDHFEFDGIEMGEYEDGDVTVFDNLKSKQ
jgi:hypothetical protein